MANKIDSLHPKIREEVRTLVDKANSILLTGSVDMLVTCGLRTFDEQSKLFKQVPKVTNAGPGQSMHNYGLALDFCLVQAGKPIWVDNKDFDGDKIPDWMEVVKLFKDAGYKWGGDFRSIHDAPHFEKTFGLTWQQLLALKNSGKVDKDGYVIL